MDVAHGLPPAHNVGVGATSPPPRPAIPPKPDKDKLGHKASAGTQANVTKRLSATDGFAFPATSSAQLGRTGQCSFAALGDGITGFSGTQNSSYRDSFASNCSDSHQSSNPTSPRSPPKPVLSPPTSATGHSLNGGSRLSLKPALPPKPVNPSLLSSPPTTRFPPPKPPPLTAAQIDNANSINNNNNGPKSPPSVSNGGHVNGSVHSPPPFLRAKPPPAPTGGEPLLSPRALPRSPPSRPNSSSTFFNFSSPIQNLNSANFPSTSVGLNQAGGGTPHVGVTSPQRRAEARVKSASLGRNITFPFSPTPSSPPPSSGGGIASIFSRKSATLSKFLPMDLQLGSGASRLSTGTSGVKPKPNSLHLNPFIIEQQRQQAQQMQQHPIKNFGRRISFSPESAMPPPPPPRLKKKLSPVNSPTSPTSPGDLGTINTSFLHSELPPPPPFSPAAMQAVTEVTDEGNAIYAEINKEKKWAERKLKEQRKYSLDSSVPESSSTRSPKDNDSSHVKNKSADLLCDPQVISDCHEKEPPSENNNGCEKTAESVVVDSWLGKYLSKPVTSIEISDSNNPPRSSTPTYQSTKTGHIYETIGAANPQDALNNNNNDLKAESEIGFHETSQIVDEEDDENHSTNQSFLFGKLVISPSVRTPEPPPIENGVTDADDSHNITKTICSDAARSTSANTIDNAKNASGLADGDEVHPTKTGATNEQDRMKVSEPTPPPPPPRQSLPPTPSQQSAQKRVEPHANAGSSYLIPTVIQDFPVISSEKTSSPQTISNEQAIIPDDSAKGIPGVHQDNNSETSHLSKEVDQENTSTSFQSSVDTTNSATPSRTSSILRRRSWNGDRVNSPSPSESSSTASSNIGIPSHNGRDRSFTCPNTKRNSLLDEEDLSTGALADAESSDVPVRSSAEDITQLQGAVGVTPFSTQVNKGFASRRSRITSLFGSFGKGSSSSSGSGRKLGGGMRNSNVGKRQKDKVMSNFFVQDVSGPIPQGKVGRQVSDSIISASSMISSPILPTSMSFDGGVLNHNGKVQSVQFSPDVTETRIIYSEHYSSAEEGFGGNPKISHPQPQVSVEDVDRRDDESVTSSESVSGSGSVSGSVSGYEDILAELSPKDKKSFYVAREILTSERTFVDVLNLLTVDFPRAVDAASKFHGEPVISNEDFNIIKGGLPNLKRVNEDLLNDLEERIAHWKEFPKIADILVKKGPFLKLYAMYIKDFQKNSMHLDTCCQKYPLFLATIKDFELSERCQKLEIKHYMLKPIQRMPQYRLLLEDYLKSLDKESEDYDDTVKGIAIVKEVAEHANEAIRLQVNAEKLLHLQNRLPAGTIILKSDRQLMKEGELHKVCRKELQIRFFALMNDCLLCFTYYTGAPKDLKLRYELPLAGMRVSLVQSEDYQNEFSVISVTRSFNLVATSPKEREEWMKALNNAIHDNIKKRTCSTPDQEVGFQLGKEAPVWVQDSRVTMCQLCTAEFTVTFRRHHCRACGKVVCGNCSGNQAPLQYNQNAASRVCDSCYEYLLDEFDRQGDMDESERIRTSIREKFKKVTPNVSKRATKIKRTVPARLEVQANSSGSRMNGYLQWREREKKSWKRRWFVLIDRVLYIYAASEDIVALKSIPLLGWQVELDKTDTQEGEETLSVFRLIHVGHHPILFQTDSLATAEKWVAAMSEAVVL